MEIPRGAVGELSPANARLAWGRNDSYPARRRDTRGGINAGVADPEMKRRLADLEDTVFTARPLICRFIADETEKWGEVIPSANIKVEWSAAHSLLRHPSYDRPRFRDQDSKQTEDVMNDLSTRATPTGDEPVASRRDVVAAALTMAVVTGAATSAATSAQAQASPNLTFSNPSGLSSPPAYSHVVEVNGPHRTVYIAGQTGVNASGKIAEGFRAQAVQVMENLKIALASVGGDFEHVVKLNSYLTDIEATANEFREVRGQYFTNKSALPPATLVQVVRLANPNFLLEVEVIAVLPPKA
jgi:enamine deaminase RidA (YjgF/YER057c/UK114 family)